MDVLNDQGESTRTLLQLADQGLFVSLISYGELYEGAHYARDPEKAQAVLRRFLDGKQILPLTLPIMERFAIRRGGLTRSARQQVGDMDLLIAATAIEHGLTLLTRNLRDFRLIPNLAIYR